jgi:glucuronosyltransferase
MISPKPKFQKFLDSAKEGAIYFSLGSIVSTNSMPQKTVDMIVKAFAKLNMKVLWKFENSSFEFSKNILTKSWLPQNDILAHENVKLFITHGGIAGIQEAIHHGVPMLVIPIFGDQFPNALKVESAKIGKYLNFHDITTARLLSDIKSIIGTPSYYTNIKRISEEFRYGGVNPLDNAIFWIEHVAKFKKVEHLKPRDYSVAWYEYAGLDMICIFYLVIKFILYILIKIFTKLGVFRLFGSVWLAVRPSRPSRPKTRKIDEKLKKNE